MRHFFLVCVAVVWTMALSAHTATFSVINTNDSGVGSLRQAILDANNNGDTVPSNDTCARPPNPAIGDKGCGGKDPVSKQLGDEVVTDVFMKQ